MQTHGKLKFFLSVCNQKEFRDCSPYFNLLFLRNKNENSHFKNSDKECRFIDILDTMECTLICLYEKSLGYFEKPDLAKINISWEKREK